MKRAWFLPCVFFAAFSLVPGAPSRGAQNSGPQWSVSKPNSLVWISGDIFPAPAQLSKVYGDPHAPGDFTMRITVPSGYRVQPYSQSEFENITVLSGGLHVGFGSGASATEEDLPLGGFIAINPGTVHSWRTDQDSILQFHGNGCLQPIYVANPVPPPPCTGNVK